METGPLHRVQLYCRLFPLLVSMGIYLGIVITFLTNNPPVPTTLLND